jgi:cellulose 1,4-beta-cellobiosidase
LRGTTYISPASVTMDVYASDIASPGLVSIDVIGAVPAGGRTNTLSLIAEAPADSPGASLAGSRTVTDVQLDWAASAGATGYSVLRCTATGGACTPVPIASPATNSYLDPVAADPDSYWYLVAATNSCGAVP